LRNERPSLRRRPFPFSRQRSATAISESNSYLANSKEKPGTKHEKREISLGLFAFIREIRGYSVFIGVYQRNLRRGFWLTTDCRVLFNQWYP
jgi:hypothetical protein